MHCTAAAGPKSRERKIALSMLHAHPAEMLLNHKILRAEWRDDFFRDIFANAPKVSPD
jgi:hypothetical protein